MEINSVELGNLISQYSYIGIFLWFVIFDQLTPIPEEVSLITLGYISSQTNLNVFLCAIISLAGLLTIDNIYYFLTYRGSRIAKNLSEKHNNKNSNKFLRRLGQKVHENSWLYLFIIEFIPRLRILSPVIACTSKIGWKKFNLINTIATSIVVAIYLFIGIFFQNSLSHILKGFETLRHFIFSIVLISIFIFIWRFFKKNEE